MVPLRVLLVDDSDVLLRAMVRVLSADYRVATASDGLEALRVLREGGSVDAIVCDLAMPRMSGIELYLALQLDQPEYARRCVFMTGGFSTAGSAGVLVEAGRTVLLKPVAIAALRHAIEDVARVGGSRADRVGTVSKRGTVYQR